MKKKQLQIMLIDDNRDDNFFHSRIIKKSGITEDIIEMTTAQDALDYFQKLDRTPPPDLVFLDINMPGMNGWEFLEKYDYLPSTIQATVCVVMLSTSDNPDDIAKAEKLFPKPLKAFRTKPLTGEMLEEVMKMYL